MKVALPLMLFGYTLVYGAVAAGGQFADNPWRGFIDDAYEVAANTAPSGQGKQGLVARILHDVFGIAFAATPAGIAERVWGKILGAIGG